MLTSWPDTWFKTDEQILGLLFDAGMLTRGQIQSLMGISPKSLDYFLSKIKRMSGPPLIRNLVLPKSYSGATKTLAYGLTKDGVRYVHGMLGNENSRVQTVPDGQMMHYMGLNDIAVRVLNAFGRKNILWLSTTESAEDLALWRSVRTGRTPEKSIRPDATLIRRKPELKVLVEFDNDTESTAKLESKFRAYRNLFNETYNPTSSDNLPPVLWVVRTPTRQDYMTRIWDAMQQIDSKSGTPEMVFCTPGNEIAWLKSLSPAPTF